ncbi:hypothetical protein SAMN06265795_11547 [Noviherbaspirillum humi]|uniref:Uncharacterized protein n=1 Tax=Noviherbaspirillum humi TaxID=1688639 RepID=A0A239KCF6_9BURK|nr:hypothetical protein SAMN06265795_11547 [Noviherbaspirillum humi]
MTTSQADGMLSEFPAAPPTLPLMEREHPLWFNLTPHGQECKPDRLRVFKGKDR